MTPWGGTTCRCSQCHTSFTVNDLCPSCQAQPRPPEKKYGFSAVGAGTDGTTGGEARGRRGPGGRGLGLRCETELGGRGGGGEGETVVLGWVIE